LHAANIRLKTKKEPVFRDRPFFFFVGVAKRFGSPKFLDNQFRSKTRDLLDACLDTNILLWYKGV